MKISFFLFFFYSQIDNYSIIIRCNAIIALKIINFNNEKKNVKIATHLRAHKTMLIIKLIIYLQ